MVSPSKTKREVEDSMTVTVTARKPGDVLDYLPERRHCREGIAVVNERGHAVDTFWDSGGDYVLKGEEIATAGLRFRLGDYREIGKSHWPGNAEAEWLAYAPADRQIITAQHGLQRTFYVRNGAEPDLPTQIENACDRVAKAESEVRTAEWRLGIRREELAELEARDA